MRVVIALLVLISGLFAQQNQADSVQAHIQLRTYLDSNQVPLNREVVYHVELSWKGQLQRYHIQKIGEPVLTNLKLRGSGSANRFYTDKDGSPHSVKRITYYLKPLELGMAYIDGVTIQYEDTQLHQSGSLLSQRLSVQITEPLPEPGKGSHWTQTVVLALVIIFLLVLAYFIYRYFKIRKQSEQAKPEPQKSLEEQYLDLIKNDIRLNDDQPDEQFAALLRLFNHYLKEKFALEAVVSFSVLHPVLEPQLNDPSLLTRLKEVYDRAELVKFAGEPVNSGELHIFYDTIELTLQHLNTGESET